MNEPLDDQYLTWLYAEVASVKLRRPSRTYWSLLRQLFRKEFVWLVPNDDNRVEDGKDLRYRFLEETGIEGVDQQWLEMGCSVLEMMIALAKRLSEEGGRLDAWFWELCGNLGIAKYNDAKYDGEGVVEDEVNTILERLIWRIYGYDGRGGLFPLTNPERDQRDVEIWYQLNAYLLERD